MKKTDSGCDRFHSFLRVRSGAAEIKYGGDNGSREEDYTRLVRRRD